MQGRRSAVYLHRTSSRWPQPQELGEADKPADAAEKERSCPSFAVDKQLGLDEP
jgi:hypothetical protein